MAIVDDATRARLRAVVAHLTDTASDADALVSDFLAEMPPPVGHNMPPEPVDPVDNLALINPEQLVVINVAQLPALFDMQYSSLVERHTELLAGASRWMVDHDHGKKPIVDDDENNRTSDFMRQLSGFAGDTGEVEVARKKVKLCVYQAGQAIDAWFGALRTDLMTLHGPTKYALPGSMQYAQTRYLQDKAEKERQRLQAIADAAEAEAKRKAAAARQAEAEELARAKALEATGVAPETAEEIAAEVTTRALDAALDAEETAAVIAQDAAQAPHDLARSRSAIGTTTGLRGEWDATVTDIKALCAAVAKGDAPSTFVTVDLKAVRAAVRNKVTPLRECAGLDIKQTFAAQRRGS